VAVRSVIQDLPVVMDNVWIQAAIIAIVGVVAITAIHDMQPV
jgi:hypothetical protein